MRRFRLRHAVQLLFLGLFLFFISSPFRFAAGEYFFRADPASVFTAAISAHLWTRSLLFGAALLLATWLWGRLFCGYICPLGAIGDLLGKLFRFRSRFPALAQVKYHLLLLFALLAAGGFGLLWLLDPLNWAARIGVGFAPRWVEFGWLFGLGAAFLALHFAFGPRAFCRVLCPYGALLGVFSRFSLYKREFIKKECIDCDACVVQCRSGAIVAQPAVYDPMECLHCGHCVAVCPTDALDFHYGPDGPRARAARPATAPGSAPRPRGGETEAAPPLAPRRAFLTTAGVALAGLAGLRWARSAAAAGPAPLRPPGSVVEEKFLNLCIRCGSCSRVCPTETLIPAGFEQGLLGFLAPVFDSAVGGCEYGCNLCGEVCPTGAIQPLPLAEKQRLRIGIAEVEGERCLAIGGGQTCLSCTAACPVEAIHLVQLEQTSEWGDRIGGPQVMAERCIGCALCEVACPVQGAAAIRVRPDGPQAPLAVEFFPRRRFEPSVDALFQLPAVPNRAAGAGQPPLS